MLRKLVPMLAVVWLVADATPVRAQILFGPVGYNTFGYRSGFRFGFGGPNFAIGGGWGSSFYSSYPVYGPIAVGPWGGFGGIAPWGMPRYYYGPGYFGYNAWYGPPVIVQPPQVIVVQAGAGYSPRNELAGGFTRHPDADFRPEPPAMRREEPVKRADFVVVRPQADRSVPIAGGAQKPNPRVNLFAPDVEGAFAPELKAVPVGPKQRAMMEVTVARQAFASGEYGRAGERLTAAIQANPNDPLPYFLLAQVRTARGDYTEAVTAIRDGMKHAPDWPTTAFRLREIYGNDAARFDEHLAELKTALRDHPENPTLLFLLGYQLWFLDEKADAAKLFKRAVERVKDGGVIERFLVEADGRKAGRQWPRRIRTPAHASMKAHPNPTPRDLYAVLSLSLVLLVFAVDLSLPLGVASAVPYTFAVLLALKSRRKWFVYAIAGLCELLTVLKMGIVPERGTTELWKVIVNRCLAGFSIGMTTFLGVLRRRAESDRQAIEEQVREHLADLAHFGRLNTAGQIAVGLAHELNQPLAAVCLQAEVAAQFAPEASPEARTEVARALHEIADQSHRAAEIVRALRRLVRRADPARDRVDLNEVVHAVVRLTEWQTRRTGVQVILALADHLPTVIGDRIQLEQVVFNLVQNAIEAVVTVAPIHRAVRVETETRNDTVTVRVRDTGSGFGPGEAILVFERFYTTKVNGTGMGLAISRSIVEAHGGRMKAENGLVDGAVFTVTLPVASEE